ncbi:DgyrCDS8061 [Dimorphilus gyrociliatus]|uniref:Translation initiation factor eIF2B subunit epsilon n=1 Tax=Dimorphilus gyrociliatus TaxID=2664684 RepID=A0A7I8VT40_9ANNE|nr:DgyrCDS8061 [Dimorphilus gyrociliatus]
MAAKRKKNTGTDLKQEEILQAVVIADSFNVRFAPITTDLPRVLVNRPLIDYTLEFLCLNGAQEIIIFCRSHVDQIQRHVESKWIRKSNPCTIKIFSSQECVSLGDALRDLDKKNIIQNDFILVNGDLISNMTLSPILQEHKERRRKEKCMVMTMIMKKTNSPPKMKFKDDDILLAVNNDTKTVLYYKKLQENRVIGFPLSIFKSNPNVSIRNDLMSTGISICSAKVLSLFGDNFDYECRDDFIKGILIDEEISGNTITVHIEEKEYAARVSNLRTYESITKEVIDRWAFPIVPDVSFDINDPKYSYRRHNIYLDDDVKLHSNCKLIRTVAIGNNSQISENAQISNSVIGRNCKIGKNALIQNAFIWDNVTIEDDCCLKTCILANHVTVFRGVTIEEGCVLSTNVTVGPEVPIPGGTLLCKSEIKINSANEFGLQSNAKVYKAFAEDGEDVPDIPWCEPEQPDDISSDEESVISEISAVEQDDRIAFYDELSGLLESLNENVSVDNVKLEINSIKAAYYMEIDDVIFQLVKAILLFPLRNNEQLSIEQYKASFKEETAANNTLVSTYLIKVIESFYDSDVLAEDTILSWYSNCENTDLKNRVKKLIEWLEEAEEESDED